MSNSVLLLILDGWGHSLNKANNAIYQANTPCWDNLIKNHPHTLIKTDGLQVGLPEGQMGNSDVGHATMGAGRTIYQDLTKINLAIEDGRFYKLPELTGTINITKEDNSELHIMGLLSAGGVHSHEEHLFHLLKVIARHKPIKVVVHAFLDGRDTEPKSATSSILKLENLLQELDLGCIGSISGRYYAMDRDKNHDRTELTFKVLTNPENTYNSALEALNIAYDKNETDEFIKPSYIKDTPSIKSGDNLIFFNFRADRAKQISYALTKEPLLKNFITFTNYAEDIKTTALFNKNIVEDNLGAIVAQHGLSQLRIAETEKYAHVTFFFNSNNETQYPGEIRKLIPSPNVATYDLKPEMSAELITDELVKCANSFDFIVCNYANADMVGHTGKMKATIEAIETLDKCLDKVLKEFKGSIIITADHGNAEEMFDLNTKQIRTSHSKNLVPCIYIGNADIKIKKNPGSLADIAPTILSMLNLPIPDSMTGDKLFS